MTTLSEQLEDALRVTIHVGQYVVVKTEGGEAVSSGYVETVDPERGIVAVRDTDSGTDINLTVDTKRYQLWVTPPSFGAPQGGGPQELYMRSGDAGPYSAKLSRP